MEDTSSSSADVPRADEEGEEDSVEETRAPDPVQVIVANNPLPENVYPSNAPPVDETHLSLASHPRMLRSVEELRAIMAESRGRGGFSNFADLHTPSNSAQSPVFPTFTRFSSTRFCNAEMAEYRIVETERQETGALYDMAYPIRLHITDSRRIPLPGCDPEGILDSSGYPLLYSSEEPRKTVRARSSGALYAANLSRALVARLATFPDQHAIRTWAHMFQLTNEKDAQAILLQRVMGSRIGDNHIALLLKAYLAYFDSIAGALDGVVPSRNAFSSAGIVINTSTQDNWTMQTLGSAAEIVNVLGGSPDYQEFWAHCCFDQPAIFAAKTSKGVMATTLFSHYKMGVGMSMVCICDCEAYSAQRTPVFFGKPNLILGYIETYVRKFGLQQQANEALQIAMLWPTLCQTRAHISLPKPFHSVDWFGGEVERTSLETPYEGLIASSPYVVLASTLASAWAMRSQIYDYLTLLTSKRNTWKMSRETIKSSVAWLVTHVSAPGVGWDFLFRHQFQITPSFLYLTGLAVEVVDWNSLLSSFSWKETQFPAHLRLIQPFWVESSVCCGLPWEDAWFPELEASGLLITAEPATIMRLLRLGLLRAAPDSDERPNYERGVFPILARGGRETIQLPRMVPDQVRVAQDHGVRVLALCATLPAQEPQAALRARDPADSRAAREAWSFGSLLQNLVLQERS